MYLNLVFSRMGDFSDDDDFMSAVAASSTTSEITPKPVATGHNWNCIQVAATQAQNPVLDFIRKVRKSLSFNVFTLK